ncbi:MAG: DUF5060 domain-containing protein [bacterium]
MKYFVLITTVFLVLFFVTAIIGAEVKLYGIFEVNINNNKSYSNPFDFREIELIASFTSPSSKQYDFMGFYNGDGTGGQQGNVWTLRFMPDEIGKWSFAYTWTDGSSGGSGSFTAVESQLPGPLSPASDNPWFFDNARKEFFDFRGYDLHVLGKWAPNRTFTTDLSWVKNVISQGVITKKYNFVMLDGPGMNRTQQNNRSCAWMGESWWADKTNKNTFNIKFWNAADSMIRYLGDNHIYAIPFCGMIHQGDIYTFSEFKVFLKYWTARFGAFYNFFGWSPTWEWTDVWSPAQVNEIMEFLGDSDPWRRPLSIHDCSHPDFVNWLSFSMRQAQSRNIFAGNSRSIGQKQGVCGSLSSAIGGPFIELPIIGSEDIWEYPSGGYGQTRNADEVRRGAWGILMAGVMPVYSEWNCEIGGTGTSDAQIGYMFDFYYTYTNYRQYQQLNSLVSSAKRQIASGIPGKEYLVYDEDGGSITIDLTGAGSLKVLWYDPKTGKEDSQGTIEGGGSKTLNPPAGWSNDAVLFLSDKLPVKMNRQQQTQTRRFGFSVMPNPVTGLSIIELDFKTAKPFRVKIYKIDGTLVKELAGDIINSRAIWDSGNVPGGIYLAELLSNNKKFVNKFPVLK